MTATINLLSQGINNLWIWTYGLVAGWGLTITLVIAGVVFLLARQIKLERKLTQLENRLIHAERDYNLSTKNAKR